MLDRIATFPVAATTNIEVCTPAVKSARGAECEDWLEVNFFFFFFF